MNLDSEKDWKACESCTKSSLAHDLRLNLPAFQGLSWRQNIITNADVSLQFGCGLRPKALLLGPAQFLKWLRTGRCVAYNPELAILVQSYRILFKRPCTYITTTLTTAWDSVANTWVTVCPPQKSPSALTRHTQNTRDFWQPMKHLKIVNIKKLLLNEY